MKHSDECFTSNVTSAERIVWYISLTVMLFAAMYCWVTIHRLSRNLDEWQDWYHKWAGGVDIRLGRLAAPGEKPPSNAKADIEASAKDAIASDDTDPGTHSIPVVTDLDQPTPEQHANPTRPDWAVHRPPLVLPPVPSGSTSTRGRHRAPNIVTEEQ